MDDTEMIRLYVPSDLKEINEWFNERQRCPLTKDELPKVGYVYGGVAAGFLYQTDSEVALLDNYVSNPLAASFLRIRAIQQITEKLIETAVNLRFKRVVAITNNESIMKHCNRFNAKNTGKYFVYSKEI